MGQDRDICLNRGFARILRIDADFGFCLSSVFVRIAGLGILPFSERKLTVCGTNTGMSVSHQRSVSVGNRSSLLQKKDNPLGE